MIFVIAAYIAIFWNIAPKVTKDCHNKNHQNSILDITFNSFTLKLLISAKFNSNHLKANKMLILKNKSEYIQFIYFRWYIQKVTLFRKKILKILNLQKLYFSYMILPLIRRQPYMMFPRLIYIVFKLIFYLVCLQK